MTDFSSSDSTLSINSDTPSSIQVEKWLLNSGPNVLQNEDVISSVTMLAGHHSNNSNLISTIPSDNITDKDSISNSDSNCLDQVVSTENSEKLYVLNIDTDGFLVPANPSATPNILLKNNENDGLMDTSTAQYVNSKVIVQYVYI